MLKFGLGVLALVFIGHAGATHAADFVFIDAFERIVCDGADCSYCSPVDPQPLCGTHSHCVPQEDTTSMCTYPSGTGTQGAACSEQADCAGAFVCAQSTTQACRQWCALPVGTCPGGATCISLVPARVTGTQEWGLCL